MFRSVIKPIVLILPINANNIDTTVTKIIEYVGV